MSNEKLSVGDKVPVQSQGGRAVNRTIVKIERASDPKHVWVTVKGIPTAQLFFATDFEV